MARTAQTSLRTEGAVDAFIALVLRYLDDQASAEEIHELKDLLGGAAHRELFVQVCRLQGNLHETFATRRAKLQAKRGGAAASDTIADALSPDDTAHPGTKGTQS